MIILGWNRDREAKSWPDYDEYLARFEKVGILPDLTWSVGRHRNLRDDDFCFLLVQGQKHPRGLVAIGQTASTPFSGDQWDEDVPGTTNYIYWDALDMLPKDDPIPVSVLAARVPGPPWLQGIQGSGYTVPPECEDALLAVWVDYAGPITLKPTTKKEKTFREGARVSGVYNRYERNPMARLACLDHYGYRCVVCDLDPVATYGDKAGTRAIEVHHIKPLHTRGGVEHDVDHIKDLRPLCPSCHAAIHAYDPVPTPAQFRSRLKRRWKSQA